MKDSLNYFSIETLVPRVVFLTLYFLPGESKGSNL
jgi:hypothetical protein